MNEAGWLIELDIAQVVVGPVYFHGGGKRASLWRRLIGPSVAYAHPADATFDEGPPLGDVLDQYVADLATGAPTPLGLVHGLKGQLVTFELQLHPPGASTSGSPASALASMGGNTFVLEGRARKGDHEVPFAAYGDLSEVPAERAITSINADLALEDRRRQPGRLLIEIHVDEWFRRVDFDPSGPADERGRARFPLGSRLGAALRWGIGSKFSYRAQWRYP